MPDRVRLSRTKGWRKPEGAIVVARPTKWGNPFLVRRDRVVINGHDSELTWFESDGGWWPAQQYAVLSYRRWLTGKYPGAVILLEHRQTILNSLDQLAGADLACWCPLDIACHADVLLELANA